MVTIAFCSEEIRQIYEDNDICVKVMPTTHRLHPFFQPARRSLEIHLWKERNKTNALKRSIQKGHSIKKEMLLCGIVLCGASKKQVGSSEYSCVQGNGKSFGNRGQIKDLKKHVGAFPPLISYVTLNSLSVNNTVQKESVRMFVS